MRLVPASLVALGLALAACPASAQEEGELPATFTSDRPGFANTSGVAAVGRLTTEMGASASFGDRSDPSAALPNLSLRVGLFDWLEARLRGPNGVGVFPSDGPSFGVDDPWVGLKVGGQLHETLSISSVWEVSIPIGTDGFRAPEANFRADLNIDWNFWGPLTLTPNLVAQVLSATDPLTGETVRTFEGGGSLKFTWQIIDVLGVFVQGYVLKGEQTDWQATVGGGLMWMVAPNAQLDVSFDIGVADEGEDPTVGLGTTILW